MSATKVSNIPQDEQVMVPDHTERNEVFKQDRKDGSTRNAKIDGDSTSAEQRQNEVTVAETQNRVSSSGASDTLNVQNDDGRTVSAFSQDGPTLEDYAIVLTDSDGETGCKIQVKKEFIQISSLIIEFPKSDRKVVEDLKIRQQNVGSNFEQVNNGNLQSILKNWFYDQSISVNANIGMSLRHLYLVKSINEENLESKHWQLYVSDDEGEEHPILSKRSVNQFIKPNCVLLLKKIESTQNQIRAFTNLNFKRNLKASDFGIKDKSRSKKLDPDFSPEDEKQKKLNQKSKAIKKAPKNLDAKRQTIQNQISKSIASRPEEYTRLMPENEDNDVIDVTQERESALGGLFSAQKTQFNKPPTKQSFKVQKKHKEATKAPTGKKTGKQKSELTIFSGCKSFAISPHNDQYIIHVEAVNILNGIKSKIYKTFADLEDELVAKLNAESPKIKYKAQMTSKYVVIKCTCCKLFAYWFQNTDKIDVEALMKNGDKNFNLVFFRSINQNHVRTQHLQIEF